MAVPEEQADALERPEGVPTRCLADDRGRGHAMREGVRPRRRGLGEPVSRQLAAGHDEQRREALAIERDSMLEPRGEDGAWDAVVLRGAEDDDGVGRTSLIAVALSNDLDRGVGR